jgi:hypothetical protein
MRRGLGRSVRRDGGSGPVGSTPTPGVANTNVQNVGGCQIFPASNPWNTNIANYPVDPNSSTYINAIQTDGSGETNLHPDFGETAT